MTDYASLAASLQPLIERVRTDVTAVKKANGEQAWTAQALTPERLARHLNGGPARGVCPIREGQSVTLVALLDFDSHGGEVGWVEMSQVVQRVVDLLVLAWGAEPVLFRSSGGRGVHLYLLWDAPQDARSVRLWLKGILGACGLRNGTKGLREGTVEVFPKQDSVPMGGNGNQFILPLSSKSCAIAWDEISGAFTEVNGVSWPSSPPVPVAPLEERRQILQPSANDADGASASVAWRAALAALTNAGAFELDYDAWRNVIFAIHHETGGSDEGLAEACAWSARSGKHDETFLVERVWPYVNSERGGAVITGRSVMSIAARMHGWSEPLDGGGFGVVEGDDDGGAFRDQRGDGGVRADAGGGGDGAARVAADRDLDPDGMGVAAGTEEADARSGDAGAVQGGAAGSGVEGERGAGSVESARDVGRDDSQVGGPSNAPIPDAEHLTTDQANANRLLRRYGRRLLVAEGRWHVWDGSRWAVDESNVYRFACSMSRMVADEADEWSRRAKRLSDDAVSRLNAAATLGEAKAREVVDTLASAKDGGTGPTRAVSAAKVVAGNALSPEEWAEIRNCTELAETLHKWSARSEMKLTIEAGVGLARKMLTIEADRLDADPWLLNTPSGVVDLRTGGVRPAKASNLMTKVAAVGYRPGADQRVWRDLVLDVCGGDEDMAGFLQRWFGYCATGSVREQVFVVHWGSGRNGKSTLLDTVARVLGDYADTAAPGLMALSGRGDASDRHPTEIAGLRGRRMVTAHESAEGAVLREDFVKQATGDDRLQARFMREDFFGFAPTHKLQLLTNHRPVIRGNDPAIWRRVLLVPYERAYGSAEQLEAGEVHAVADRTLAERLRGDPGILAGVMAWIVDGAVDWWTGGGLRPPEPVRLAVAEYRSEQDRLGQFVRECCEVAPAGVMAWMKAAAAAWVPGTTGWWNDAKFQGWSAPLAGGMQSVYSAYVSWCRESGVHALARTRFAEALGRTIKGLHVQDANFGSGAGRRRASQVFGLRLLET